MTEEAVPQSVAVYGRRRKGVGPGGPRAERELLNAEGVRSGREKLIVLHAPRVPRAGYAEFVQSLRVRLNEVMEVMVVPAPMTVRLLVNDIAD